LADLQGMTTRQVHSAGSVDIATGGICAVS
jgi:hypothetical protein